MVIDLAGQLQDVANEMRAAAGLDEFGWNTVVFDQAVTSPLTASATAAGSLGISGTATVQAPAMSERGQDAKRPPPS
jgi:hypothetical protein